MDRFQVPPELMGVAPTLAPAPTPPPTDPPMPGPMGGMMGGPMGGMMQQGVNDPVLQLLQSAPPRMMPIDPEKLLPPSKRKGYMKLPDKGYTDEVITSDQRRHQKLIDRFGRDLQLYRQKEEIPNVPPQFDPLKELAFKEATLSNIVNKLTNMSSAADWRYVVPFKDEPSKINSQIVENWLMYLRQCEEEDYAHGGGDASLQWDEFLYLYLYGRVVCRILPDPADTRHPYHEDLIDPAVCYPEFGNTKEGMVRMSMVYESTVLQVVKAYSRFDENIEQRIIRDIGYTGSDIGRYFNETGTVKEYWDTWNRRVTFRDVVVIEGSHELGYIPFIYVSARGEPAGMGTPRNGVYGVDEHNNAIHASGTREDLEEKGVSVFHHIKNTHRMTEIVFTLLISEVLKSQNPAVIEYMAPQLWGNPPPPVKFGPNASNRRVLNAQQVDIVPTSPRPTDTSPVLNKIQADTVEGSINPAMYGSMDGSNIAGFAVESLISAARDTVLPYTKAWQTYQAGKAKIKMKMYVNNIYPVMGMPMTAPMEGQYGSSPSAEVTPEVIQSTGTKVTVEMIGVSDSALPAMMNVSAQGIKEGIWSRRKAMEKLGEKDPAKMLQDIILEKAVEHPEIMENIIIPQMFVKNGQQDLATMWGMMVVMPKLMQTMQGVMGGMPPPGMVPGGGGPPGIAPPPTGPQQNGQSNPMAGRSPAPPGGPLPGQGRGPA
jgi:hypothetical protein